MMPKRWLAPDGEASELERTLLALSPDPEPEPGDQERVWQNLLARLPGPTEPEGSGPAASPTGATDPTQDRTLGTILANHGLGFAVGVVSTTLAFLLVGPKGSIEDGAPSPRPLPAASSAAAAGETTPAALPSGLILEKLEGGPPPSSHPVEQKFTPNPGPADSVSVPRAASSLSEEVALLREARSRLAHGDLDGASKVLAASKAKFPNARLAQEREAATIELLRRSGDAEAAAARARAFLAKYPRSPHARQVQRALPADAD